TASSWRRGRTGSSSGSALPPVEEEARGLEESEETASGGPGHLRRRMWAREGREYPEHEADERAPLGVGATAGRGGGEGLGGVGGDGERRTRAASPPYVGVRVAGVA